jgi:hypothetical protein
MIRKKQKEVDMPVTSHEKNLFFIHGIQTLNLWLPSVRNSNSAKLFSQRSQRKHLSSQLVYIH